MTRRGGCARYRSRRGQALLGAIATCGALTLRLGGYPVALADAASSIGPEFPTDPPIVSSVNKSASAGAVASDGTNHFAVWTDSQAIWGGRVRASDGAMLDASAIPICTASGPKGTPSIAFDGTNFLVVFTDGTSSQNLYGVLVAPDGTLLKGGDPATSAFLIATAAQVRGVPRVAFGGGHYLVVWEDVRSDAAGDIFGARVTPQGGVVGGDTTAAIRIPTAAAGQEAPSVAYDGSRFLVAWDDRRLSNTSDIYAAFVAADGTLAGDPTTGGVPISSAIDVQETPSVSFDGSNFLLAWADRRSGSFDVRAAQLTSTGSLVNADPSTSGFVVAGAAGDQVAPAVAFDGTRSLVVWTDKGTGGGAQVRSALVTTSGTLVGDPAAGGTLISAGDASAVTFGGGTYGVAWSGGFAVRVSTGGAVLDTPVNLAVEATSNAEANPAIAFDGQNYMLAWADTRNGGHLLAIRIRARDGAVLDSPPIDVAASPRSANVALTFDGSNFLLAWFLSGGPLFGDRALAIRVTPGGAVLGSPTVLLTYPIGGPFSGALDIGFDGSHFLVVMRTDEQGPRYSLIAQQVNSDGSLTSGNPQAPRFIVNGENVDACALFPSRRACTSRPQILFDGTSYMLVWEARASVRGIQLRPDGTPIGNLTTDRILVSEGSQAAISPSLAYDGTSYFVVWEDYRSQLSTLLWSNIFGQRVSKTGGLLGTNVSLTADGLQTYRSQPTVAFDGTSFLVTWRDKRSGGFDLYGGRVTTAATPLDGSGFPISTGPNDEVTPVLASGPAGQELLAYGRDVPALHASRVFGRILDHVSSDGGITNPPPDASPPDGGTMDGPSTDALPGAEGGSDDAADGAAPVPPDGPLVDATVPDGMPSDGGADATVLDASRLADASRPADAGPVDAAIDAGSDEPGDSGCGCKIAGTSARARTTGAAWTALLALVLVRRSRRRREPTCRAGSAAAHPG